MDTVVLFNMCPIIVHTSIRPEENNKLVQGVDVTVGGRKCSVPLVGPVGIAEYTEGAFKLTVLAEIRKHVNICFLGRPRDALTKDKSNTNFLCTVIHSKICLCKITEKVTCV